MQRWNQISVRDASQSMRKKCPAPVNLSFSDVRAQPRGPGSYPKAAILTDTGPAHVDRRLLLRIAAGVKLW